MSSSRPAAEGVRFDVGARTCRAALAPRRLAQYEFDLVARDADVPQLAVGQLRQRAPLPRALGHGPPRADLTPYRPLPQCFERMPDRRKEIFADMRKAPLCEACRQERRRRQPSSVVVIGL